MATSKEKRRSLTAGLKAKFEEKKKALKDKAKPLKAPQKALKAEAHKAR